MPELPEVETVCRGMRQKITDMVIDHVDLYRNDLRFPIPKDLRERVKRQKIKNIHRRNKYILIDLANDETMMIHLGMSGRILFHADKNFERQKHDHVLFHLNDGGVMVFNDPRRFGVLDIVATPQLNAHRLIKHIGIDPFDDRLTSQWLGEQFNNKKTTIKAALLDQRIIAGLGNIYVCEALFRAKIHPETKAGALTADNIALLLPHIRTVLTEAIAAGGSSLRDYVQTDGELGYFQKAFQVYDREGDDCVICQTAIERITQSGRSTYFCPCCQNF